MFRFLGLIFLVSLCSSASAITTTFRYFYNAYPTGGELPAGSLKEFRVTAKCEWSGGLDNYSETFDVRVISSPHGRTNVVKERTYNRSTRKNRDINTIQYTADKNYHGRVEIKYEIDYEYPLCQTKNSKVSLTILPVAISDSISLKRSTGEKILPVIGNDWHGTSDKYFRLSNTNGVPVRITSGQIVFDTDKATRDSYTFRYALKAGRTGPYTDVAVNMYGLLDSDKDGVPDVSDNCQDIANGNQADIDGDDIGDACDSTNERDPDGDGVLGVDDNCPFDANSNQADIDGDDIGDACDSTDNRRGGDPISRFANTKTFAPGNFYQYQGPFYIPSSQERTTSRPVVWRPTGGNWFVKQGSTVFATQFGLPGDVPMHGDIDGDGFSDPIVWRKSNLSWYFAERYVSRVSGGGYLRTTRTRVTRANGTGDEIPLVGDMDGDGKDDFVMFRPSTGRWRVLNRDDGSTIWTKVFGANVHTPFLADLDNDGKDDLGLYRTDDGRWAIDQSSKYRDSLRAGSAGVRRYASFGISSEFHKAIPLPADIDNNGTIDLGYWSGTNGRGYYKDSESEVWVGAFLPWSAPGDIPILGDFNGDKKIDFASWDPVNLQWKMRLSPTPITSTAQFQYGLTGDVIPKHRAFRLNRAQRSTGTAALVPIDIDTDTTCVDTDPVGDGWGWDGSTSCTVEQTDTTCIDTDPVGDGWGWDGSTSCRVN